MYGNQGGGQENNLRNISLENLQSIFWYPPTIFLGHNPLFSQRCNFFLQYFWDPPIFFTKFHTFLPCGTPTLPTTATEYGFQSSSWFPFWFASGSLLVFILV